MGKCRSVVRVWISVGLLLFALPECKSTAPDDDGGSSGHGGTSGAMGGSSAAAPNAGGAAGTAGGTAGSAGAVAAAGSGNASGMSGAGGAAGHAGGPPAVGGVTNTCSKTPLVVGYPDAAPIERAKFDAMFPAAVCAAMKPCCATKGTSYDEAACQAFATAYYDKTLTYDPLEGAHCLQSLGLVNPVCDDNLGARGLPGACVYVYRSKGALGDACDRNGDCAPDPRGSVECAYSDTAAMDICTVMIRGQVEDACDEGCELTSDLGVCYPNDVPMKLGEWVTCHAEDGLRCNTNNRCEVTGGNGCECHFAGDLCDGSTYCPEDTPTCTPRGGPGAPCFLNDSCQVDTYCPDDGDKKCTPRKHAGESCSSNDECLGLFCLLHSCNLENRDAQLSFDDAFCDGKGT